MPPCNMSSLIQAITSTAQSHSFGTIPADIPGRHKRRGRHFRTEQSETADPMSHTPVEVSLHQRGCSRLRTKYNGRPLRLLRLSCYVRARDDLEHSLDGD